MARYQAQSSATMHKKIFKPQDVLLNKKCVYNYANKIANYLK